MPSLGKAWPAAPKWLNGLFCKMVANHSEDRYQSANAMVSDRAQTSAPRSGHVRNLNMGGGTGHPVVLALYEEGSFPLWELSVNLQDAGIRKFRP